MPIGALDQPLFSADALGWDFPAGSFCEDFHCESSMRSHRPFHLSCLWVILRSCGWTILLQSLCLTRIYLFHVSFDGWLVCFHVSILVAFIFLIKMMIFPMHVGDRVCPWSLFHCQGNFSVFCSFIRMLQLEETLLCKQCAQCVVCLWLCFVSAVPNVDNFCIFILPIVWIFWLFVALICDLWRWTERSMIILQRHSGSFHFLFFTLDLWGCYQEEFNLLHWKPKVAGESDSQFIFESRAHRFVCFIFFEVNRCSNIVVPLRGVHSWFAHSTLFQAELNSCIRLWIHLSFRVCLMEVELDTQWSLRGMSVQRDGSPRKACWTLRILNSKGSEHALSVLKLEHRTMVPIKDG